MMQFCSASHLSCHSSFRNWLIAAVGSLVGTLINVSETTRRLLLQLHLPSNRFTAVISRYSLASDVTGSLADAPLKVTRFAETPESSEVAASSQPTNSLPTAGSATPAYTDNSNLSELRLDGASRATSLQTERTDDTDVSAEGQTRRRRRRTRRGQKQCVAETEDTSLLGIQIMPL